MQSLTRSPKPSRDAVPGSCGRPRELPQIAHSPAARRRDRGRPKSIDRLAAMQRLADFAGVVPVVEADADDLSALHDLIGHVPFFSARQRLRAKLSGVNGQTIESSDESKEENWF